MSTDSGTQATATATELEIHPEYKECTAFGLSAEVETAGCNYRFGQPSGTGPFTGNVSIVCETGKNIVVKAASTCTITVGSQGPLSGITYTNSAGPPMTVTVGSNVGVSSTVSGNTLICGTNGTRPGTYTGSVLVKGWTSSAMTTQRNVTVKS